MGYGMMISFRNPSEENYCLFLNAWISQELKKCAHSLSLYFVERIASHTTSSEEFLGAESICFLFLLLKLCVCNFQRSRIPQQFGFSLPLILSYGPISNNQHISRKNCFPIRHVTWSSILTFNLYLGNGNLQKTLKRKVSLKNFLLLSLIFLFFSYYSNCIFL